MNSTIAFYGSLKGFWRRRQYQRLEIYGTSKKNMNVARLGGKRKSFWRIRAIPKLKLKFKIVSPIKLLAKLRDAYINMMLGLAGNVGSLNGDAFFGGKRIPKARKPSSSKISSKQAGEFESKLIFEIYKALKASPEFASQYGLHQSKGVV
ncbi:hypothetical protein FRX31_013026 [Thalictrum thalictroides]|uniref:Uncharacterized protein n=1 Tax=Thalictrum thalictroides TaxID=46969 RepID=A0A7J6WJ16_THATH|nr:hypothetical protein FRX31_013026 [Thalictrum thalictroides]